MTRPARTAPLALALVSIVAVLLASPASAQDDDDVNSDRPGIGTSAMTVPRGAVQLETGVAYARERATPGRVTPR